MPEVLRAETFYTPPPPLPSDAWAQVPGAELAVTWYETRTGRLVPRPEATLPPEQARWARIDAGRWVADCTCRSAQIISIDDPRMTCVDCHTGWYVLLVPADPAAAEAEVAALPTDQQFWWQDGDPAKPLPPTFPEP